MERDIDLDSLLKEKGIENVVDNKVVLELINKVLNENTKVVNDYLEGNPRSLKFLMGQVMKESHGSVNPKIASDLLIKTLEERK